MVKKAEGHAWGDMERLVEARVEVSGAQKHL